MKENEMEQKETMVELKGCALCGAKPEIYLGKKRYCQLHGEPHQYVHIRCKNAGHTFKVTGGDVYNGGYEKAKEEAIKEWNTRPLEDQAHIAGYNQAVEDAVAVLEDKTTMLGSVSLVESSRGIKEAIHKLKKETSNEC